jgi:hypothetical protein
MCACLCSTLYTDPLYERHCTSPSRCCVQTASTVSLLPLLRCMQLASAADIFLSSRWPAELPASNDVEVQVVDGLAAVLAVVDDDAEAALELQLLSDALRHHQQMTQQRLVAVGRRRQLS